MDILILEMELQLSELHLEIRVEIYDQQLGIAVIDKMNWRFLPHLIISC